MTSPSFERIDYQLRHNKHIERKILFSRLSSASSKIDFSPYKYLGFGSVWFVDFKIAHKQLGISHMLSMEREDYAQRARFNAPLGCIKVEGGESNKVLSGLNGEFWSTPTLCWMDYDGCLDPTVVEDIALILDKSELGSVIAISVNASHGSYRPRNITGRRSRLNTALGQIESMLPGIAIPPRFDENRVNAAGNHSDIDSTLFPEYLATCILLWMTHRVQNSKRQSKYQRLFKDSQNTNVEFATLEFLPLYNFCHKDGAEMITVGGMLIDGGRRKAFKDIFDAEIEWSIHEAGLPAHERIDLIPMTLTEKTLLDTCLPETRDAFVERAKERGIQMQDSSLEKYWKYYKEFPTFLEANH